ncbi:MAG: enoyl-CoA hydratase [Halioglobus sp.]
MNLGTDIDEILVDFEAGVLTLRMNRPAKKNALIGPMYTRMAELMEAANHDADVRVILLTGSETVFSSGNDVASFTSSATDASGELPSVRFLNTIAHCEVPLVAAVNGYAIGVGTTLLLHCDLVIAGDEAVFQTPFVDLGVAPEAASSYTLPQRVGPQRAAEMLLLGERYTAQQALDWGLVNAVYPPDRFQEEALTLARKLAKKPPTSLRATKKLLRAPLLRHIEGAMQAENAEFARCMQSPEFAEAITAFMERRAPDFSRC